MRKSKYSDSQILAILKQNEDGVTVQKLERGTTDNRRMEESLQPGSTAHLTWKHVTHSL